MKRARICAGKCAPRKPKPLDCGYFFVQRKRDGEAETQDAAERQRQAEALLMNAQPYIELAHLRAWELAIRHIERIQRQSDFFHWWHYWDRQ